MSQVTIEQAMQLAMAHRQAGRLQDAEAIYRRVLAVQADHPEALHSLGMLAVLGGQFDRAAELIGKAIGAAPQNAEYHCDLADLLQKQGQFDQAIAGYQRALAIQRDYVDAHNNLGLAWQGKGEFDQAIVSFQRALALKPDLVEAHINLGNAYKAVGQRDLAVASYQRALSRRPDSAEAQCNLGAVYKDQGELDQAIACYQRAMAAKADFAEAHYNLGLAMKDKGRLDEAIACYEKAISINPGLVDAHNNLGVAWYDKGQFDAAMACYHRALAIDPTYAQAHYNLGTAVKGKGLLDDAIACYQRALAVNPGLVDAHNSLGVAWYDKGQIDRAIACYQRTPALDPTYAEGHSNLGNAYKDSGRIDMAMASFRKAMELNPNAVGPHDNLMVASNYDPDSDPRTLFVESRRWNSQHAEPLARFIVGHSNDRDPERRLRIGYVSSDFLRHASAYFLLPLFSHHNRRQVEAICYAQVTGPDRMTGQMQDQVQGWRSTVGMTDAQVAALVRQDRIDILVDLKLHTADNRLLVFAHKPAPIQVTWLGYPGTTGMDAIDYRLSDPYLDPPDTDEGRYSERTIRLPDTFWCYDPLTDEPEVSLLPCSAGGLITFGCLNNFCKVNDGVISLWANVLNAVPRSRLLLLAPEGSSRQGVLDRFGREAVAPDRIEFVAKQPRAAYLRTYHRIDIALDTFPYNGHTTSLDALWMGVPVITLVGKTVVGRAGLSQLSNLRLPELIAQTRDQYVQIAAGLAGDLPRLAELRSGLRPRMRSSPLMDAGRFARAMEGAYRTMWRNWCAR